MPRTPANKKVESLKGKSKAKVEPVLKKEVKFDKKKKNEAKVEVVPAPITRKRGRPKKSNDPQVATEYEKFGSVKTPKYTSTELEDNSDYGDVGKVCHMIRTNYGYLGCLVPLCGTTKCKMRRKNINKFLDIRDDLQEKYGFEISGFVVKPPPGIVVSADVFEAGESDEDVNRDGR